MGPLNNFKVVNKYCLIILEILILIKEIILLKLMLIDRIKKNLNSHLLHNQRNKYYFSKLIILLHKKSLKDIKKICFKIKN